MYLLWSVKYFEPLKDSAANLFVVLLMFSVVWMVGQEIMMTLYTTRGRKERHMGTPSYSTS